MVAHTRPFVPLRSCNPHWTIDEADAAMLAEAELIKRTWKRLKPWPKSEIEKDYEFYRVMEGWVES